MSEAYDIGAPAVLAAASALAERDGLPLTQNYLRDAEFAVKAAMCTKEGCLFWKGHDGDCSDILMDQAARCERAVDYLEMMVSLPSGSVGFDAVADSVKDFLGQTNEDNVQP